MNQEKPFEGVNILPVSISFKEFGNPMAAFLLEQIRQRVGAERITSTEEILTVEGPNGPISVKTHRPLEFQNPGKGEDRITCIGINGALVLMIADGVTATEQGETLIEGLGAAAANEACLTVAEILTDKLVRGLGPLEVMDTLNVSFLSDPDRLKAKGIKGATTLSCVLLYQHDRLNLPHQLV